MIVSDSVVWNTAVAGEAGDYNEYQYRMAGDSEINGVSYKKVVEYHRDYPKLYGLVRESGKKIYFQTIANSGKDTEIVAYDFNLGVGDTFMRVEPEGFKCPIILQSIDSVKLNNGEYRKRYNFKDSCYHCPSYWIEGIGSSRGPFELSNIPCFGERSELTCYFLNHELLWSDDNDLKWFCNKDFAIAAKVQPKPLNIYPNPATELLHIDGLPTAINESCYEVVNMKGQVVQQGELAAGTRTINVAGLKQDGYILSIIAAGVKYMASFEKE
jgi:hypothetical protein